MGPVQGDSGALDAEVYRVFAERVDCALVLLDPDLRIAWTSPRSGKVLGRSCEQLVGMSVLDLVHPDDLDQIIPVAMEIVDSPADSLSQPAAASAVELPIRVKTAAGGWTPVSVSGRVYDAQGRLLAVIRPAAERYALDRALDELGGDVGLTRVLNSLVALMEAQFDVPAVWLVHDHDDDVVALGPDDDSGVGEISEILKLIRAADLSSEVVVRGDRWVVPILCPRGDSLFGVFVLPEPRPGGPSPFDRHVLRRTTTLASLAFTRSADDRLLRHAAATDPLTGVLNRRAFEAQLARLALDPNQFPVSLFFIDVDGFKAVNDCYGHGVGDGVLIAVAERLVGSVRGCDVVGRFGGDEFAISVPRMPGGEKNNAVFERLTKAFVEPMRVRGKIISISVSIGTATADGPEGLERVVDLSDEDMYRHKPRPAGRQPS